MFRNWMSVVYGENGRRSYSGEPANFSRLADDRASNRDDRDVEIDKELVAIRRDVESVVRVDLDPNTPFATASTITG